MCRLCRQISRSELRQASGWYRLQVNQGITYIFYSIQDYSARPMKIHFMHSNLSLLAEGLVALIKMVKGFARIWNVRNGKMLSGLVDFSMLADFCWPMQNAQKNTFTSVRHVQHQKMYRLNTSGKFHISTYHSENVFLLIDKRFLASKTLENICCPVYWFKLKLLTRFAFKKYVQESINEYRAASVRVFAVCLKFSYKSFHYLAFWRGSEAVG